MEANKLSAAIDALKGMPKVDIHGKGYSTVATRVEVFRRFFPDHSLTTEILPSTEPFVRVKATVADSRVLATGMAEEDRTKGQINRTSALENCETSAIGRALAAFGLHGGEFATADEVANAIHQQAPASRSDAEAWGGPLTKTDLKKALQAFNTDLVSCTDADTLHGLLSTSKAVLDQCKRDLPGWWFTKEGGDTLGFQDRINERMSEFLASEPDPRG